MSLRFSVFMIAFFSFAVSSYSEDIQILNYKIKKKDSLLELCGVFKVSEKELIQYNNEEKIQRFWEGDSIRIPLKKIKIISHKIKKGDTLFDLVNHYKSDIETIYLLNNETLLEKLWVGKTILIPVPQCVDKDDSPKPKKEEKKQESTLYRVKKGDSYYNIAKNMNLNYEELEKINSGKKLVPGDTIQIPKEDPYLSEPVRLKRQDSQMNIPGMHYKTINDTQLKSPCDGEIAGIRPIKGYGRAIFIKGKKGISVLASKGFENLTTSYGAEVKKGQTLAVVRKDYFIHFFLIQNNEFVHPKKWVK